MAPDSKYGNTRGAKDKTDADEVEINVVNTKPRSIDEISGREIHSLLSMLGEEYIQFLPLFENEFSKTQKSSNEIINMLTMLALPPVAIAQSAEKDAKIIIAPRRIRLIKDVAGGEARLPQWAAAGTPVTIGGWYCESLLVPGEWVKMPDPWFYLKEYYSILQFARPPPPVQLPDEAREERVESPIDLIALPKSVTNWARGDDIKRMHQLGMTWIPPLYEAAMTHLFRLHRLWDYMDGRDYEHREVETNWMYALYYKRIIDESRFNNYILIARRLKLLREKKGEPEPTDQELRRRYSTAEEFLSSLPESSRKVVLDREKYEEEIYENERHNHCEHKRAKSLDPYLGQVVGNRVLCKLCQSPIQCEHYLDFIRGAPLHKYYVKAGYYQYCRICGEQLVDETIQSSPVEDEVDQEVMVRITRNFHRARRHLRLSVLTSESSLLNYVRNGVYKNVSKTIAQIDKVRGLSDQQKSDRGDIFTYLNIWAYLMYLIQSNIFDIGVIEPDDQPAAGKKKKSSPPQKKKSLLATVARIVEHDLRGAASSQPTISIKGLFNDTVTNYVQESVVKIDLKSVNEENLTAFIYDVLHNPTFNPTRSLKIEDINWKAMITGNPYAHIKPTSEQHKFWLNYAQGNTQITPVQQKEFDAETHKFALAQARLRLGGGIVVAIPGMWQKKYIFHWRDQRPEKWRYADKFVFMIGGKKEVRTMKEGFPTGAKLVDLLDKQDESILRPEYIPEKDLTNLRNLELERANQILPRVIERKPWKPEAPAEYRSRIITAAKNKSLGNPSFLFLLGDMNGRDYEGVKATTSSTPPEGQNYGLARLYVLRAYYLSAVVQRIRRDKLEGVKPIEWTEVANISSEDAQSIRNAIELFIVSICEQGTKESVEHVLRQDSLQAVSAGVTMSILDIYAKEYGNNAVGVEEEDGRTDSRAEKKRKKDVYSDIDYDGDNDDADDGDDMMDAGDN